MEMTYTEMGLFVVSVLKGVGYLLYGVEVVVVMAIEDSNCIVCVFRFEMWCG